ncbi:hypothetical protein M419DRAFT_9220 [Trichoderma reesei RUT C-30]|uniref:Uncharacterized protein n=1 Tax=Hypocrea jecorina (strain ATCC 56765 / BCRC 32924 / NRRL 11460 / Rut C-30) TaxID=1344414 RepID=A0A024S7L8_HYPJR|nr:hypothetical protein M419DRAFT_9220 [Trichoderma reesei RUT C-30]
MAILWGSEPERLGAVATAMALVVTFADEAQARWTRTSSPHWSGLTASPRITTPKGEKKKKKRKRSPPRAKVRLSHEQPPLREIGSTLTF